METIQSHRIRSDRSSELLLVKIQQKLKISLDNVPVFVREEVILQTLINLRTVFSQHPDYKTSVELQEKVFDIEGFIEQLY